MDLHQPLLSHRKPFGKYFPVLVVTLATGIYLFFLESSILHATGGVFSYPLDDPFVHMQVARNLALHGSWGIQPGEFASACSSIFYPLLLAGLFKLFGLHTVIPFLLNGLAGVLLIFAVNNWLLKQAIPVLARTVILLLAVLIMPLPVVICTGMEHCFQTLFTFLFITSFSDYLIAAPSQKDPQKPLPAAVWLYGILVTGIRYEGLFLIAVAALILLWYRKPLMALLFGVTACLPLILFGIISVSKGSYFLANSIVIKSGIPFSIHALRPFFRTLFNHFVLGPGDNFPVQISFLAAERMLVLLPVLYLLSKASRPGKWSGNYFLLQLFFLTLLHLVFAQTGWLFRYEAYLLFSAACIAALILYIDAGKWLAGKSIGVKVISAMLLLFLVTPALTRSAEAFFKIKLACVNIFEQQYQSAGFIRQYFPHDAIFVCDIGAVSWFTEARMTDIGGLGNMAVARHMKENDFTAGYLDSLRRDQGVRFALVARDFRPYLFSGWTLVASMQISNNFSCGNDTVVFYVPDAAEKAGLSARLRAFQSRAPATIGFRFY